MVLLAALAACGRLSFDSADGGSSGDDAVGDGQLAACPAFALFCEDFESGSLSQWNTTDVVDPATLAVTSTMPHGGGFALEATSPPNGSSLRALAEYRFTARTSGVLAVRFYMWLSTPLNNFSSVMALYNQQNNRYLALGGDELVNWVVPEDTDAGQFDLKSTSPTPAANAWNCVELVYTFAPARAEVFVNGVNVLDRASNATAASFSRFMLGVSRGDQVGLHVVIDDVVLAAQRIGC